MELLIGPAIALFLLAVLLRSGKRRDSIDWKSRGLLVLLSTAICLLLDRWIRISALNAAEAAATAGVALDSFAVDIRARYQPVLLPLYIALVAVLIDVLSRLINRYSVASATSARVAAASKNLLANSILFVLVPALPYAWATNFTNSGSIIGDAAREVLIPIIATYGAPAHWLQVVATDSWAWQRVAEASWPWNPAYRSDSRLSFYGFLVDCIPWLTLALAMSAVTLVRNTAHESRSLREYFVAPQSSAQPGSSARIAFGPWRGRVALMFTVLWIVPLALWLSLVVFVSTLPYALLWLFLIAVVAALAGLVVLVNRTLHRSRGKTMKDTQRS